MKLDKMIQALQEHNLFVRVQGELPPDIAHIAYNSRNVQAQTLFVCKGFSFREAYLLEAVSRGAVAAVTQVLYAAVPIPQILVTDIRKALSLLSLVFYDDPSQKLAMVGITGTKGKTTTTFLLKNIMDLYSKNKAAILSTVLNDVGDGPAASVLSTPESLDLQRLLRRAVENKLRYAAIEVSSQAYKQQRLYGVQFAVGVFLNFGEDHISEQEHSDMDDYLACKIFLLQNCKTAIINGGTDQFDRVYTAAQVACENVIVFSDKPDADYVLGDLKSNPSGVSFSLSHAGKTDWYALSMSGGFNAENACAAIIAAQVLGMDAQSIIYGLRTTRVSGRMELYERDGVTVIVDYAHNHLSLSRLYAAVKQDYPGRRIVALFGCPGNRAQSRRRDMCSLSGENADFVYLTAEDPQNETVANICAELAQLLHPYGISYKVIEDRDTAIKTAIQNAKCGDVILLLAKGEETYQKVQGQYIDYASDSVLARKYLGLEQ